MKSIQDFTYETLLLNLPLYTPVSIDVTCGNVQEREINNGYENEYYTETPKEFQYLIRFITESNSAIYGYCPNCNKKTYFTVGIGKKLPDELCSTEICSYTDSKIESDMYIPEVDEVMDSLCRKLVCFSNALFFDKHFCCPYCQGIYKAAYTLAYNKAQKRIVLSKIGQYPHLSLVSKEDIDFYNKILEKFDAKSDYQKAIRNNANGDNIAAFVYLRRVIEKYVDYIYLKNSIKLALSHEKFSSLKTLDKISQLKNFVPDMLIQNREIYSVVSLGIHQLNEEKCRELYPCLKDVIDHVLSVELEKAREKKITEKFQAMLQKEKQSLKKST